MDTVQVLIMGIDKEGWPVESHFRSAPRDAVEASCNVWLMSDTRLNEVRAYAIEPELGLGQNTDPIHVAKLPWIG